MSHRKHRRQNVKGSTRDYFEAQIAANHQIQKKRSLGAAEERENETTFA
jgi:hypothetical protein